MIVALSTGRLRFATKGARGQCPVCAEEVIARVGEIVAPHWAHRPDTPCEWADHGGETLWHAGWKMACADPGRVEYVRGEHRTDVISPAGVALEFQHSAIEPAAIRAREKHWRRGCWIYDGTTIDPHRLVLRLHPDRLLDDYRSVGWDRPSALIHIAKWPMWIDLGDAYDGRLLKLGRLAGGYWSNGPGWLVDRQVFIDGIVNGWGLTPPAAPAGGSWDPQPLTERPEGLTTDTAGVTYDDKRADTVLDWRDSMHWSNGRTAACIHCGEPSWLLDDYGHPAHKTCVELLLDHIRATKKEARR